MKLPWRGSGKFEMNFRNKYHSTDNPGRFQEENQMGREFFVWYSRNFGISTIPLLTKSEGACMKNAGQFEIF